MIYLVTYDLRRPGQTYAELHKAIKMLGDWAHPLESTWLIDASGNASAIYNALAPHIDKNDSMLVVRITKDYQGWLPANMWEWINCRAARLAA